MNLHHSSLLAMLAVMTCTAQPPTNTLRFTGEVKAGQDFRKSIGHGLIFLLKADDDGWIIEVHPENPGGASCRNYSTVIATPLHGYTANDLNVSYGISAAEALKQSPREVAFVLDADACKQEDRRLNKLLYPSSYPPAEIEEAQARFGTSPTGKAVLRILQSKVRPSGELVEGKDPGKIDWIKFEVQITFPRIN